MSVQTYAGSCQCGAVAFTADLNLDETITCNCSRCQRLGSVLCFTSPDAFNLIRGEGVTTEYLFNTHTISHRFCQVCGIQAYGIGTTPDGGQMVAVNVNCLDGVDPRGLKSHHYDGRKA